MTPIIWCRFDNREIDMEMTPEIYLTGQIILAIAFIAMGILMRDRK